MPVPVPSSLASMTVPRIGGSVASQIGLASAPFLSAPQVAASNPVGAPQMGFFGRMRANFGNLSPLQQQAVLGAFDGLGSMGQAQGQGFAAPPISFPTPALTPTGGGAPYPAAPMDFTSPPTVQRRLPTPLVTPQHATAPNLAARLGNLSADVRSQLGVY